MAESLEDFLKVSKKQNTIKIQGSLTCIECDEVVQEGFLDEDQMILSFRCSLNHESRVKV